MCVCVCVCVTGIEWLEIKEVELMKVASLCGVTSTIIKIPAATSMTLKHYICYHSLQFRGHSSVNVVVGCGIYNVGVVYI